MNIDDFYGKAKQKISQYEDDPDFIDLNKKLFFDVDSASISLTDINRNFVLEIEEGILRDIMDSSDKKELHVDLTLEQLKSMLNNYQKGNYPGLLMQASGLKIPLKYKIRALRFGKEFVANKDFREKVSRFIHEDS